MQSIFVLHFPFFFFLLYSFFIYFDQMYSFFEFWSDMWPRLQDSPTLHTKHSTKEHVRAEMIKQLLLFKNV